MIMKKVIISSLLTLLTVQSFNAAEGIGRFSGGGIAPDAKPTNLATEQPDSPVARFGTGSMASGAKLQQPKKALTAKAQQDSLMAEAQHVLETRGVDALADWICSKAQEIVGKKSTRSMKSKAPQGGTSRSKSEAFAPGAFG